MRSALSTRISLSARPHSGHPASLAFARHNPCRAPDGRSCHGHIPGGIRTFRVSVAYCLPSRRLHPTSSLSAPNSFYCRSLPSAEKRVVTNDAPFSRAAMVLSPCEPEFRLPERSENRYSTPFAGLRYKWSSAGPFVRLLSDRNTRIGAGVTLLPRKHRFIVQTESES